MEQHPNAPLQLALDFVEHTNKNIFLTGKAGTGKTTFLRNLKSHSLKRMVVVAPTGVAAMNAGGMTIHSFFQIPFGPYVPQPVSGAFSATPERPVKKFGREKINIIRSLDLLVIDEISMVRADLLDAIDEVLRQYKDRNQPFGGVQLLMIGDLQQLAPVAKEDEWKLLKEHYQTPFFFGSQALQKTEYVSVVLQHIYRQRDETFIAILNAIRENELNNELLQQLNSRYVAGFSPPAQEGYITLTTHNYQAQQINETELRKLTGREHIFPATTEGDFPDYMFPTEPNLVIKKGAQVMFAKNDTGREKRYYNGKIGTVLEITEDGIVVQGAGDDEPLLVQPVEWTNYKYALDEQTKEIRETVSGIFRQYPLKLAWAITIHKSQGLTFDKAIIDANAAFTHGQVYVALSRCRSLEGLVLKTPLAPASIISNASIKSFTGNIEKNPPTQTALQLARQQYQQRLILELFDFGPLQGKINYCGRLSREHAGSLAGNLPEDFSQISAAYHQEVLTVCEKFIMQMKQLRLDAEAVEDNQPLQERMKQAGKYFVDKLETLVMQPLKAISVDTDNKAVRKAVRDALDNAHQETFIKVSCLKALCTHGFTVQSYLEARAKASLSDAEFKVPKKPAEEVSQAVHPKLYTKLKAWRDQKAREWDVPTYLILPIKTMEALAAYAPRTADQLKEIKGLGKKKIEQLGEEILSIIHAVGQEEELPAFTSTNVTKTKPAEASPTKQVSYDLFKAGKSIEEIAQIRNQVASTVEGHLAHYIGTGELDILELVSKEKVLLITHFFTQHDTTSLGAAKAALGDAVSFGELRLVMKHFVYKGKQQSVTDK